MELPPKGGSYRSGEKNAGSRTATPGEKAAVAKPFEN